MGLSAVASGKPALYLPRFGGAFPCLSCRPPNTETNRLGSAFRPWLAADAEARFLVSFSAGLAVGGKSSSSPRLAPLRRDFKLAQMP